MKTLEKAEMLERNKVMRVLTEARILSAVDHPFLASLYGTIITDTHLHFLMQLCDGGELYALLTSQPSKRFKESHVRFYTAEVVLSSLSLLSGEKWPHSCTLQNALERDRMLAGDCSGYKCPQEKDCGLQLG